MPQMMPMNWIILPLIFISIYILTLSKMFFMASYTISNKKPQPINNLMITWTW